MNPSTISHRSVPLLGALAALACALGSVQAFANRDIYETLSVKVSYADLNLDSVAGATALYSRIKWAARQVCSSNAGGTPIDRYRGWKQCFDGSVSDAVAKVNSPLLTAMHSSKADPTRVAALLQRPGSK